MAKKTHKVSGQDFIIDDCYNLEKVMGQGAYGIVCAVRHKETRSGIAVKKITNIFTKSILAKRALREMKILQHFRGHKNITCLFDMDIPTPENFNECYLYEDLMECDLGSIIRSGQPLTDAHFSKFVYQIICGLHYIHSASVLHRDLKPGNLLVNADCDLKICDFGLARGFSQDPEENAGYMTEYVATRWYRAPEIMLTQQNYTKAIDVWSVGCILGELLGRKPLFKGRDYVDQLNQILNCLGPPDEESISLMASDHARDYVRGLNLKEKVPFETMFPEATPDSLDLLDQLLCFNPRKRITVEEALVHRYLQVWYDDEDIVACPTPLDFSFEKLQAVEDIKQEILKDVKSFRKLVRTAPSVVQEERQRLFEEHQKQQAEAQARAHAEAQARAQAEAQQRMQQQQQAMRAHMQQQQQQLQQQQQQQQQQQHFGQGYPIAENYGHFQQGYPQAQQFAQQQGQNPNCGSMVAIPDAAQMPVDNCPKPEEEGRAQYLFNAPPIA